MTQIYRSPMEFTNFDEISDRPHTKRACDERAASVRATARRRERNFKLKVSPRVGETSVRRRAGNGAQTRTTFYMKMITAHWPEWRATPCGQRRADENEILCKKKQPRADDRRWLISCGQRRADENEILCKKTNRA